MAGIQFFIWNGGKSRYWDGVCLRDCGGLKCKGLAEEFCRAHRIVFFEWFPEHWPELTRDLPRGKFHQVQEYAQRRRAQLASAIHVPGKPQR